LYDAHSPRVFRLAFRLTGDADLAREFTQDTFVRAFGQLAKFRGDSALSTWLHRITVTVVANAMRKVKRFRARETDLEDGHPIATGRAGVGPGARERRPRAKRGLAGNFRTTPQADGLERHEPPAAARGLGVGEGSRKGRPFPARAQLRAALHDLAPGLE